MKRLIGADCFVAGAVTVAQPAQGFFRAPLGGSAKKQAATHTIEFELVPNQISIPKHPDEFDGYFKGYIRVLSSSNKQQNATGMIQASGRILSLDSSLVYSAKLEPTKGRLEDIKALRVSSVVDMHAFIEQTLKGMPYSMTHLAKTLVANVAVAVQSNQPEVQAMMDMPHTSFFRLPRIYKLWPYALPSAYDSTDELLDMTTPHVLGMTHLLKTAPWRLVWYSPMQKVYRLPRSLGEREYYEALKQVGVPQPPAHIAAALRIYFYMVHERERRGDTAFESTRFHRYVTGPDMWDQAMMYLQENDVRIISPGGGDEKAFLLCLAIDYKEAKRTMDALRLFQENALNAEREPELRGARVPIIPPTLTDRQAEIARHVQTHWLTIIEGESISPRSGEMTSNLRFSRSPRYRKDSAHHVDLFPLQERHADVLCGHDGQVPPPSQWATSRDGRLHHPSPHYAVQVQPRGVRGLVCHVSSAGCGRGVQR